MHTAADLLHLLNHHSQKQSSTLLFGLPFLNTFTEVATYDINNIYSWKLESKILYELLLCDYALFALYLCYPPGWDSRVYDNDYF